MSKAPAWFCLLCLHNMMLFLFRLAHHRSPIFSISIRYTHNSYYVWAKTDVCALSASMTNILHFLPPLSIRPTVSIFQYAQGNSLSLHYSSFIGSEVRECDTSSFLLPRSDDLMIFPAPLQPHGLIGSRCGELLRCLAPVTFYYFTVINLARMQTLYWNGWNITSASQAERAGKS